MAVKYNHWDVARAANTMAVVSSVSIDPTKITVRIKNKLIRWLEQGHLEGGYASQARKLGDMLADKFELPTTMSSWRGLHVRTGNPVVDDEVSELFQADWTAEILDNPSMKKSWYGRQYEESQHYLRNHIPATVHLYVFNKDVRDKIIKVQQKNLTDKDRAAIQRAIDAINGTEPIHVFTYQ